MMDYFKILKNAYQITLRNKFLWLFGFLLGIVGATGNFSGNGLGYTFDKDDISEVEMNRISDSIKEFFVNYWIWILVGLCFLLLLIFIFSVLAIISQGALIGCVDKIESGAKIGLKEGFKLGWKSFWRILGLKIITSLFILLTLTILGIPVILLFINKMFVRGILLLLLAFVIFIPLVIVASFMNIYGFRYVVINKQKVLSAIKQGLELFKANLADSIVMALLLWVVNLASGLALFFIILILAVPLVLIGFMSYFIGGVVGIGISVGLGVLLLFVLLAFFTAVLNVFKETVWTLTFRELIHKTEVNRFLI